MQHTLQYNQHLETKIIKEIKDSITLTLNDTLIVLLEENPTTGFRWSFNENNFLALEKDNFSLQEDNTQNIAGNGGIRQFQFKAIQAGNIILTLVLQQAWQTEILSKININIEIKT